MHCFPHIILLLVAVSIYSFPQNTLPSDFQKKNQGFFLTMNFGNEAILRTMIRLLKTTQLLLKERKTFIN